MADKFKLPKRYQGSEKSVWAEYNQIAAKYNPLNLGHGFADFSPPSHITKALAEAVTGEDILLNQYTRGSGHPRLVNALAKLYSKLVNQNIDPLNEVIVTIGAFEAVYCSIIGHVDDGDEVIIIEPYFECYEPMVRLAGGIPKFVPLRPKKTSGTVNASDWMFDEKELEAEFNEKTKIIIINTPHNPLGKVLSQQELEKIAELCKKWNVLCISDEVYEWLVYKPFKHIRIASLPGMWERTLTIGSAGKTFSITGWKIGWVYGPANLMNNLKMVHQSCIYTCATPLQEAIAVAFEIEIDRLGTPECYFVSLPAELEGKRDFMVKVFNEVGMNPTIPNGGFFLVADWSPLASKINLSEENDEYKDYRFTKWMAKNVKILGIPSSSFYSDKNKSIGENYVRYCFIKKDETLKEMEKILKNWKSTHLTDPNNWKIQINFSSNFNVYN